VTTYAPVGSILGVVSRSEPSNGARLRQTEHPQEPSRITHRPSESSDDSRPTGDDRTLPVG
jgi:hypothetical protein